MTSGLLARTPAWIVALVVAACLGLPLAAALLGRVPDRREEPLATIPPEIWNWQPAPVPIPGSTFASVSGDYGVHQIELTSIALPQVIGHSELHLLVATYETEPDLDHATIAVEGTSCIYRTAPEARFPNNDVLIFHRGPGCQPLQGTPSGSLALTVRLRNTARLALWTYFSSAPQSSSPIGALLDVRTNTHGQWAVRGRGVTMFQGSSRRRIELLAYVWQTGSGPAWIWWTLGFAVALIAGGSAAYWGFARDDGSHGAARRAAGAFGMCFGLAMLYAIATPPFQAADEPNHFMGFAQYAGRPSLAVQAAEWARLTHFERIQFDPTEKFRPSDVGRPGVPWDDGAVPVEALRGSGVRAAWQPVAALTDDWPAPRVLLALRSFNALLFGLGVAGFVWGAKRAISLPSAHLLAWPLLFIPTLPFFGMHVSNHAPLLAAYTALGLGVLLLILDAGRPAATGLVLGTSFSIAVALSRSAIPLAPFAGMLLLGRLCLADPRPGARQSFGFWLGLALPLAAIGSLVDPAYIDTQARLAPWPVINRIAAWAMALAQHPWLLIPAGAAAAGLELAVSRLRARVTSGQRTLLRRVIRASGAGAAVAAGAVMATSLWIRYPLLAVLDPAALPSPAEYVGSALRAAVTSPRLRFHDHLTSVSFWGGFGWIDTLPPWWLISLLTGASGASLIVLMAGIARTRALRPAVWLMFAAAGALASVAAYAFTVISVTPADLHGRYLLGLYLIVLLICWSPLAGVDLRAQGAWRRAFPTAAAASIASIHGYCLHLILTRYF